MVINKSISMPLHVVNAVLDEAEVMGKDFSSTLMILVKIGLNQRKVMEIQARNEREEYAKAQLEVDKK